MDDLTLRLFEHGEELGPDAPLVYLAMPLSQLGDDEERRHVELFTDAIVRAIEDTTQKEATDPWPVRIHSPLKWSAPWGPDELTPSEVYELNTGKIWEEADALIVIGHSGGSLGSGQELIWAFGQHLPVLYVYPHTDPVSRQLTGACAEHDVSVVGYGTPEDLRDKVGRWLGARRHVIVDGPRRRRARALRFAELRARLESAWESRSVEEQLHVVGTTRIAKGRIERLITSPHALAAATAHELSALGGALQVEAIADLFAQPLPDLRSEQVAALVDAADELGWDVGTAFRLYELARLELARGGVRRLPLANIQDWVDFYESQ